MRTPIFFLRKGRNKGGVDECYSSRGGCITICDHFHARACLQSTDEQRVARTQHLYFLVFLTRYANIFWWFKQIEFDVDEAMKLAFLGLSGCTCAILTRRKSSCLDEVKRSRLILFGAIVSSVWTLWYMSTLKFVIFEFLYTFSFALESVAILPQMHMTKHKGRADQLMSNYIFCLFAYRLMYILHWFVTTINRLDHKISLILASAFLLILFCYFKSLRNGNKDTVLHGVV